MNNETFYDELDFKYPEIGIALSEGFNESIKVYIPAIMPLVPNAGSDAKSVNNAVGSKSNILNSNSLSISSTVSNNYVNIRSPRYIGRVHKGDNLVIVFIGGDPNKPVIIGRSY